MTAGIATAINITFGDLPHGMDENDSERAREAQKISHDSKLLHLNGDTYVDHSVEHQNASQLQLDTKEDESLEENHRAAPQSQLDMQGERSREENQLPQTIRDSKRTSSAAASSETTSSASTSSATTSSTTSSATSSAAFSAAKSSSTTFSARMSFVEKGRPAPTVTHQNSLQQHANYDERYDDTWEKQVFYVNGKPKQPKPRSDGVMYSKEGLHLIGHYLTKIENDYVPKVQFDDLELDFKHLEREHKQLKRLHEKDKKSLSNLQESILSRVDRYQPKSDAEIEKEFREIGRSVVELSGDLVSDAPLEVLQESLSGRALSGDMDVKVWETMKKWNSRLLVESVIWKELYESFFENPFRPFGPSEVYIATWNALFGEGPQDLNLYPAPSEASEQWRVVTVNALNELSKRDSSACADIMVGVGSSLVEKLVPIGFQIEKHWKELAAIIYSAQELAKTLSTQKARLRLFLPELGECFSKKKVYKHQLDPANRHGEDMESGEVLFVVAPGLRKWGDGFGRCLEIFNDIIASRVLIAEAVE